MKVRIEYLDGVAGLLICYMMLNHIILRANIGISVDNVWLEPLQFFMFWFFYKSGMFYKPKPTKQLLVSGGHKLLLPWLVFGVAGHLINCVNLMTDGDYNWKHYFLTPFKELLFTGGLEGNRPLWFLFTLFWTQLIFNYLFQKKLSAYWMVFGGLIWAIIMYLLGYNSPTYMVNIPLAIAVYALGYLWKDNQFTKRYVSIALIAYLSLMIYCLSHLIFAANVLNPEGVYVLSLVFSIAGCILFNNIFKYIPHFPVLQYIGRHSMVYYISHWLMLTLCLIIFGKLWHSNFWLVVVMGVSCLFFPPMLEQILKVFHLERILGKQ